jgi:hypothetical protein
MEHWTFDGPFQGSGLLDRCVAWYNTCCQCPSIARELNPPLTLFFPSAPDAFSLFIAINFYLAFIVIIDNCPFPLRERHFSPFSKTFIYLPYALLLFISVRLHPRSILQCQ